LALRTVSPGLRDAGISTRRRRQLADDRGQITAVRHDLTDEETLNYIGRLDPEGGAIDPR
jgi:hypothetical protein